MSDESTRVKIKQQNADLILQLLELSFKKFRKKVVESAGKTDSRSKEDGSPVTELDVEIEKHIIREFYKKFPDIAIFGEEGGTPQDLPNKYWLIDSIDGTESYIKGIPAYTAMAVCIENGEATSSLIYDYSTDSTYVAIKDKGALKNGKTLSIEDFKMPKIAYCPKRFVSKINSTLKHPNIICEIAPTGAGNGFIKVVEGVIAARFNFPRKPGGGYVHDYAPGALLVIEAGGCVISLEGDNYNYDTKSFIACHPDLEATIKSNLNELSSLEK